MIPNRQYKCGWLELPRLKIWRKNSHKRQHGFCRQRHFERWRYRRCHYHRHSAPRAQSASQDAGSSSVDGPAVFTAVLNIDKRTNECSSLSFDSDSSTMVCGNNANIHVCNNRQSFVGELQPVTGHQVATIGGRGNALSGILRYSPGDLEG